MASRVPASGSSIPSVRGRIFLASTSVTMKELLEAGVHFGHQTKRWNPKMKEFIFGERNGIYIIDLQKTLKLFRGALKFASQLGAEGKTVLFVGTKRQAQEIVAEEAERSEMFYVNQRWLGGLLTNFVTVQKSIARLRELNAMATEGRFDELSKKEVSRLEKERRRLEKNLRGILHMDRLPDALFVIDSNREAIAVHEARKLRIPVIAIVDTNCDPGQVDHVIPGNDDALRAIRLFASRLADAIIDGRQMRENLPPLSSKEGPGEAPESPASKDTAEGGEATGAQLQPPAQVLRPPA